jgi:hypothetical protein
VSLLSERTSTLTLCRGCAATIRFVRMHTNRHMPVEPVPLDVWLVPGEGPGRITLVDAINGTVLGGIPVSDQGPTARRVRGYVPHWAKCPAAKRFKRPTRRPASR